AARRRCKGRADGYSFDLPSWLRQRASGEVVWPHNQQGEFPIRAPPPVPCSLRTVQRPPDGGAASRTGAEALGLVGAHFHRLSDQRGVPFALRWPEPPGRFFQDVGDALVGGLGEPAVHGLSVSGSAAMSPTDRFESRPARVCSTPMPTARRRISI